MKIEECGKASQEFFLSRYLILKRLCLYLLKRQFSFETRPLGSQKQKNAGSSLFGYIFTVQVALICCCTNQSFKCSLILFANGSDNFQNCMPSLLANG